MAHVTVPAARLTPQWRMPRSAPLPVWPPLWTSKTSYLILKAPLFRPEYGAPAVIPTAQNGFPVSINVIEGHVYQRDEDGVDSPVHDCQVVLFVRNNWQPIARCFSDSDGHYKFIELPPGAQYFAVAFDVDGSPLQNAVILDKLTAVAP